MLTRAVPASISRMIDGEQGRRDHVPGFSSFEPLGGMYGLRNSETGSWGMERGITYSTIVSPFVSPFV